MSVKQTRTRDEQAEATRAALLAVARRLFATRGYPDVSTEEIVQAARVTKGALYHHFKDKQELFRGVVEQIQQEIRARLQTASAKAGDGLAQLRAACHEYLDACVLDEVGRIVVLDSPAVLGWDSWCKINREYGIGFFVERLRALQGEDPGLEATAQMLLGALNVAGRVIAQASDRSTARAQVGATIDRVLAGIAGSPT
jgi:AcrR family transcriptional regulator